MSVWQTPSDNTETWSDSAGGSGSWGLLGLLWILFFGRWNDRGIWDDTALWKDLPSDGFEHPADITEEWSDSAVPSQVWGDVT